MKEEGPSGTADPVSSGDRDGLLRKQRGVNWVQEGGECESRGTD